MIERELQQAVIECAQLLGWRVAHFRPAETTRGWRTPVQADGKGFPDLVCVHRRHGRVLFVELKAGKGQLSGDQTEWLDDLTLCSNDQLEVHVWRPADWLSGAIETALRPPKGDT